MKHTYESGCFGDRAGKMVFTTITMDASGVITMAFGPAEPNAGPDAAKAVRDRNDYILNGRKCFITVASMVDSHMAAMVIAGIIK